jgi:hypothetical protein
MATAITTTVEDLVSTIRHHASELRKFRRQFHEGVQGRTLATPRAIERHQRELDRAQRLLIEEPSGVGRKLVGLLTDESELHWRLWESRVERPELDARLRTTLRQVKYFTRSHGHCTLLLP